MFKFIKKAVKWYFESAAELYEWVPDGKIVIHP